MYNEVFKINSYVIVIFLVLILLIFYLNNNLYRKLRITKINKKRGVKRNMPKELIKDFIGKVCSISIFNDSFGVCGKIVAVEDNWIKVVPYRSKTEIKLINGDMIRDISVMPDKYQNKV